MTESIIKVETLNEEGNIVHVSTIANSKGESLAGVEKDAQVNVLEGIKINGGEAYTPVNKVVDLPVYTIEEADAKFLQASDIANKADKATTLSGYGIVDAYTKNEIDGKISSVYKPGGTKTFDTLPTLTSANEGFVYNITDEFTTTADFVEGANKKIGAGADVAIVNIGTAENAVYKYNVLPGFIDLSEFENHNADNTIHITENERNTWNAKQDTISDLATIRTNASAGAEAKEQLETKQNTITETSKLSADLISAGATNTVLTVTDKSKYDAYATQISEKADATATAQALGDKADKATTLSGYGITDAYTKTEAKQTFLSFRVVQ